MMSDSVTAGCQKEVASSNTMGSCNKMLRIVLLGKDTTETSQVGNFILGRSAFETEAPPASVEQYSERARGHVEGRYITIINTPHLFHPEVSVEQSSLHFRECLSLCAPGPHVFLLVLESDHSTKDDEDRITCTLNSYSPWLMKYTIILDSGERRRQHAAREKREKDNQNLYLAISKSGQHRKEQVLQLLEKVDEVIKWNEGGYLTYDIKKQHKEGDAKHTGKEKRGILRRKSTKQHALRIVLLGMNEPNNNMIGNFLMGRDAFETEAPPASVEQHSERARGHVKGKYITIINTPHLFDAQLSLDQITLRIEECVSLAAPGPHAFLLVIQHDEFTTRDKDTVNKVLSFFGKNAFEYTTVLTIHTYEQAPTIDLLKKNQLVQDMIKKCSGGHYKIETGSVPADLLKVVEKMAQKKKYKYLLFGESKKSIFKAHERKQSGEQQEMTGQMVDIKPSKDNETKSASERLNLVLCGRDAAVKTSISNVMLGQREQRAEPSSECVRREGEVCGHLITLVEMPALYNTQLSEEEVMQQTLHYVSLCHPGVHAFIFTIPEGRLTDEDKAEMETMQRIFSSRVTQHTIVLISQESLNKQIGETLKPMLKACAGRHLFFSPNSQVLELIRSVQGLLRENGDSLYTAEIYTTAQVEKYKNEVGQLKQKISDLAKNSSKPLRIVLLGKTGVGKSASGNTILGQEDLFMEDISEEPVTRECKKEVGTVNGRQITVIDTPGLNAKNTIDKKEIVKCISMEAEGPHAFLLTVPIGSYSQDTDTIMKTIQDMFGEESIKYTMVLFTRGDDLKKKNIEQYIEKAGHDTKELIRKCGNRYHVFNNRNPKDRGQITALLDKTDSVVESNGGSCYNIEMFKQTEEEKEEESDEESEKMMENVAEQRRQQLLWYRRRFMNDNVQKEDDHAGQSNEEESKQSK